MAQAGDQGERRGKTVRIAAMGDTHYRRTSSGSLVQLFTKVSRRAELLLLAGDLTHNGRPEEARALGRDLRSSLEIPVVAVLGNHDFEAGVQGEVEQALEEAGVVVLDGDTHEVGEVGVAGVKGFGGGYGRRMLAPWGEATIKSFVQEAVSEALKLEAALNRLQTPVRLALLHYSPVRSTVEGEPPEILPFVGCSRLEDPIDRYQATAVFHGHSHRGSPTGATKGGSPVHNVAMPVLARSQPDLLPFFTLEVEPGAMDELDR